MVDVIDLLGTLNKKVNQLDEVIKENQNITR